MTKNQAIENVEAHDMMVARTNRDIVVDFRIFYAFAHNIGGHTMKWTWEHIKTGEDMCLWTVHTKIPGSEGYRATGELAKRLSIGAIAKGDIIITSYEMTFDFSKEEQDIVTKAFSNQKINIDV